MHRHLGSRLDQALRTLHVVSIVAGANLIVAVIFHGAVTSLTHPAGQRQELEALHRGVWTLILGLGLSASFGTVVGIWQFLPLIRHWHSPHPEQTLRAARRCVLRAPLFQASLSFLGWMLGTLGSLAGAALEHAPLSPDTALNLAISNLILGLVCFAIVYYWLEIVLRTIYVPRLFPQGGLTAEQLSRPLSVRTRFYIYYFAVCVFPVLLLTATLRAQLAPPALQSLSGLLYGTALGILVFGAWLTLILSLGYQQPLVEMKRAVGRVRNGDYDVRVKVRSDDEIGALGDGLNEMALGLKERELMKTTLGRLVDPSVRDHLLSGNLQLGGEMREAAVLFVDIRGFTTLSERMQPQQVVQLLNAYFNHLGRCITAEGGVLNKYIGDAMMAVFGAPLALENPAASAVRAALRMRSALVELNAQLESEGLPTIRAGSGIHAGPVLAGNIGSEERMEYTVIGDTVNVASRVEGLCKELSCDVLLTHGVRERLGSAEPLLGGTLRLVTTRPVRGRQEQVQLYTVDP